MQRYLFSAYISFYHTFSNRNVWNATLLVFRIRDVIFHVRDIIFHVRDVIFLVSFSRTYSKENFIFVTESIFYKFYYFPKFSFSAQNLFLLSIPQHVIASKSNHINTMFPNEMILAPLQKRKIKYELSYQSTTRLKYIDKFDQLLIIHQWTSTVDNTVRSLMYFTILSDTM